MSDHILTQVRRLLMRAVSTVDDPALTLALERLDEPLRVAIAGKVKAGKSTLLNAMVGEELAPTDAGECTRLVTWYRDGQRYEALLHLEDGNVEPRPFDRVQGALRITLGRPAKDVDHIEVRVPSRRLRTSTLIDTPGIGSISADVSLRTMTFLEAAQDRAAQADAVIYLLRHMHSGDVRFLEAFHGDDIVQGSPVNTVGVLSRADEIGSCRPDSMETAARVAARYQSDERMRRLCPVVVPVAGLLAVAGATLREDEYRTLAAVAAAPTEDAIDLMLTADRFGSPDATVKVPVAARRAVLARLGLFGVRHSVQLIRGKQAPNAQALAAALTAHSGLDRLNEVLTAQFVSRGQVLKARSALSTLDLVVRSGKYGALTELVSWAEEIRSAAHEFVEVRLLHLLRSGRIPGKAEHLADLERLLGGSGAEHSARLGLPPDAHPHRLADAAREAIARCNRLAEHPLSQRELRNAARAAVRSCEAIVIALRY
ncbi:GTPase [Virgisporangium aliadipatigenens]|uniref:GTPase n=1 Tax=Virgisporangium aliadipatigenens TaxID=741659 RepID=A0A8J3YF19_9ACTN|nr:dynamin family protein [Virgisporangium aliadipatigenens]GIJ43232.1 GTPase [Virgisporangium aliadipatigenens]